MKKSQNQLIKERLEKGFSISPAYAYKSFGCLRLAARINELRDHGMSIKTEMVTHGEKRFALYKLAE